MSRPTKPRLSVIAVASATTQSVKHRLRDYLAATQPPAITAAVWRHLLAHLAPVSESYLRDLLRATDLPFEQPYAGIRRRFDCRKIVPKVLVNSLPATRTLGTIFRQSN